MKQLGKHKPGKDDEMQTRQDGGNALIVPGESAEARTPREVDRQMHLGSLASLMPAVACSTSALRSRLQRPTVPHGGAGLPVAPRAEPQPPQIVHDRLEIAGRQPAAILLIELFPARQVVGQHPSGYAASHQIAQGALRPRAGFAGVGWHLQEARSGTVRRRLILRRSHRRDRACVCLTYTLPYHPSTSSS